MAANHPRGKLEDQAATAALYADRSANPQRNQYLDSDNRLSSAGAAASLKYADPMDLPSFPSRGFKNGDSAAGAAASLGWQKKSPEVWRADSSAAASKAAMLAKDYKAPSQWHPEQSSSGAKAAVLAARDGGKVDIWRPEQSAFGSSAANQAFKGEKKVAPAPKLDYATAMGRKGSLMAASGAMSGTRKRSDSTPLQPTYPDEENASSNALNAASVAHKPRNKNDFYHEAGSTPYTNMPKEMFTSHPPVSPEVDEKRRADVLRASAVAMAKQMYSVQQKQIEQAHAHKSAQRSAAASAHGRSTSMSTIGDEAPQMRFNSLQEAAQKLAQERLAKLRNEHDQNREFRDYYGSSPQTNRLSIRNRVRRRASSDGTLDEDKEQSQKIRAQMSIFASNVTQIDEKKRQKDRDALLAVAQRNVTAKLKGMDEKAFQETGKVQPSMLSEWEVKAHAAAQKNSESRMENYGKVNIGGGKFIDQSEIDAVAARNVQPVLDEINEKAEQQRARDAELKAEQEARVRKAEAEKAREKEAKEISKKLKQQEKDEEREKKREEKAEKAEEKRKAELVKIEEKQKAAAVKAVEKRKAEAAKAEEKRLAKEEKRKSKEATSPRKETAVVAASTTVKPEEPTAKPVDETAKPEDTTTKAEDTTTKAEEPTVLESGTEEKETEPAEAAVAETETTKAEPIQTKADVAQPVETEPAIKDEIDEPESPKGTSAVVSPVTPTTEKAEESMKTRPVLPVFQSTTSMERNADARLEEVIQEGSGSPKSPKGGVKGWLKKLRGSKDAKSSEPPSKPKGTEKPSASGIAAPVLPPISTEPTNSSMNEVALAGTTPAPHEDTDIIATSDDDHEREGRSKHRASSVVSSVSPVTPHEERKAAHESDNEDFEEARDNFDNALAPPPVFTATKSASPVRDSKFTEEI